MLFNYLEKIKVMDVMCELRHIKLKEDMILTMFMRVYILGSNK